MTWFEPEIAAAVAALVLGTLAGLPGFHRALQQRRRALRACLSCGRTLFLGERTCDCERPE